MTTSHNVYCDWRWLCGHELKSFHNVCRKNLSRWGHQNNDLDSNAINSLEFRSLSMLDLKPYNMHCSLLWWMLKNLYRCHSLRNCNPYSNPRSFFSLLVMHHLIWSLFSLGYWRFCSDCFKNKGCCISSWWTKRRYLLRKRAWSCLVQGQTLCTNSLGWYSWRRTNKTTQTCHGFKRKKGRRRMVYHLQGWWCIEQVHLCFVDLLVVLVFVYSMHMFQRSCMVLALWKSFLC